MSGQITPLDPKYATTTTRADEVYRVNGCHYYGQRCRLSEYAYLEPPEKDLLVWFAWEAEPEAEENEDYQRSWVVVGVRTKKEMFEEIWRDAYKGEGGGSPDDRFWRLP